jgi:hypothetical protein
VAENLSKVGLKVWFDKWSIAPGVEWAKALHEAIAQASSTAVLIGSTGFDGWQGWEFDDIGLRARRIILVLLPGARTESFPPAAQKYEIIDMQTGFQNDAALASAYSCDRELKS